MGGVTDPEEVAVDHPVGLLCRLRQFELISWKVGRAEHLVWLLLTVTLKCPCMCVLQNGLFSFFPLSEVEAVLTLSTPSSLPCTPAPPTGQDGSRVEALNPHFESQAVLRMPHLTVLRLPLPSQHEVKGPQAPQ